MSDLDNLMNYSGHKVGSASRIRLRKMTEEYFQKRLESFTERVKKRFEDGWMGENLPEILEVITEELEAERNQ